MAKIVILTGAGISAESGLGTFRDKDGLWTKYDLNEVATPEGFAANPALVHEFYNARRKNCVEAAPNAAHAALARLEQALPEGEVIVVTQNVDDLHERAGSRAVLHMHGELAGALCASCDHRWPAPAVMAPADPCPACGAPATRPDIVWFGEVPFHLDAIESALLDCTHFVAIGTSGNVYPAAGMLQIARSRGAKTIVQALELPANADGSDEFVEGRAAEVVPDLLRRLG